MTPPFTLRRLGPTDARAYRALRLEALRTAPQAFGASIEEEEAHHEDFFAARLRAGLVLGAEAPGGGLAGMVGLATSPARRQRHKATLWGMFVRPEARGTGLGAALVEALLTLAPPEVEEVRLSVLLENQAALRLYERLGFTRFAIEPRALRIDGRDHDEALMLRRLPRR